MYYAEFGWTTDLKNNIEKVILMRWPHEFYAEWSRQCLRNQIVSECIANEFCSSGCKSKNMPPLDNTKDRWPSVVAPLSQLGRRYLLVLYILQQSASFPGLEKVLFACFYHSKNLYTNRTRFTDCNAGDRILEFTFGRIFWLF